MDVSVIICTHNRCDSLRETLQSVCELRIPRGVAWELVVVDNNSKDATGQVCQSFADRLPLRYFFEPRPGASCARNAGIENATAPLLFFSDDDVTIHPDWFVKLWQATQQHPEIGIFAGRIVGVWQDASPSWLKRNARSMLRLVSTHLDLGEKEQIIEAIDKGPWGPNMALRKSLLGDEFRFSEQFGRTGKESIQIRGGETEMIQRLFRLGHKGLYVGTAIVHHRNPASHATERYVFSYFRGAGKTEIRLMATPPGGKLWMGVPRYFWFKVAKHAVQYVVFRWARPPEVWLRAEIEWGRNWGRWLELRRLYREGQLSARPECRPRPETEVAL
ncbi:MAG TPA: glycosyltransferase [Verrucomicrobiae bacterium]|nr:glycosyltransferase [Verrucomicrobiae bacterium]